MKDRPLLMLVLEPEAACRTRLAAEGFDERAALEISSYLAQSSDLAPEFAAIEAACASHGVAFRAHELDAAAAAIANAPADRTLVWTLTDGIAYFRGGAAPAMARLSGLKLLGADDSLFALCQDKFRSGAVLRALGMPVPEAGLARDGRFMVSPPVSRDGWFVKPNRLGAKIGIWRDSRVASLDEASAISRRIYGAYRDDAVVQPYVPGRNVRASFLAVEPGAGPEALGIVFVDSGGDFQTMAESMALYGATGATAKRDGLQLEPALEPVAESQPGADAAIRVLAGKLMDAIGLHDVFSLDLRVEADDTLHLIEFEVCPGLPCFDFRDYCRRQWGLGLAEAMAATAVARLSR